MTAKLKMYPRRIGWLGWNDGNRFHWKNRDNRHQARVRVVDAREMTAEKAVEKALQTIWDVTGHDDMVKAAAYDAGMNAEISEGRVRVRRTKK